MIKVLVISDDMTGNNDTGALLNQIGLNTVAAISDYIRPQMLKGREALCLNTDSRALPPKTAKEKVKTAVQGYWKSGMLCCKRIDSTLRGNVGSEIDGMLDALPEGFKAVVVPAFPRAGRICVGGHMLVHGVALAESGAAKDPKTPVHFSRAADIIAQQSKRRIQSVYLQEIQQDRAELAETIQKSDAEILVMDAVSEEDIERIAQACRLARIPAACVDPGSFSVRMARGLCEKKAALKNLLVIGSLSDVTRKQAAHFEKQEKPLMCRISPVKLLNDYEAAKEEALSFVRSNMDAYESICFLTEEEVVSKDAVKAAAFDKTGTEAADSKTDGNDAEEAPFIAAEAAGEISRRFARIGAAFMEEAADRIACVYLCGGDIARDFLDALQIEAIDIMDEVIPLAVYGKILDSRYDGIQILTKGGMIGENSTICDMIEYARQKRFE